MRLFNSPRQTRRSQFSCVALVVSVMLASFQLLALAHPERIEALIVQDAVAHNEGLGANWKPRRAFWADRAANENTFRTNLLSLQTTRARHVGNDPNVERYDPDLWTDEFALLSPLPLTNGRWLVPGWTIRCGYGH